MSIDEDTKRLQRYLSEAKFPFPVARIDATQAQQMMRFDNTPSTFYVDRSGIVRYRSPAARRTAIRPRGCRGSLIS